MPEASDWIYRPLPTQIRFHADLSTRYKGFSGPVGSGKSLALVHEALFLAALNPGLLGLLGAPTYPMLRDATQTAMWDVLAQENIFWVPQKSENSIILPYAPFYGSKIIFRSLEDYERLRGTNLAWFGIDELTYCRPEAWTRLEARLRHPKAQRLCGMAAWTPKGFDWVYERFIANPPANYKAFLASPRENVHIAGTGVYDAMAAGYDEKLYRQEVLGEYLSVNSGSAYYAFDRRLNVKETFYDHRLPLCWSLDFNINPMCSVIAQIEDKSDQVDRVLLGRKTQEVRILDELYLPDSNTMEACEAFAEHCERYKRPVPLVVYVYGDATGSARQRAAGVGANSDWALIKQFFANRREFKLSFKYKSSNPPVRDRVTAVNGALCNSEGDRRLFVDPRCKRLRQDLEQVVWKAKSEAPAGGTALDQKSDPMLTHISDALGYLIETEMGFRQSGGPRTSYVA